MSRSLIHRPFEDSFASLFDDFFRFPRTSPAAGRDIPLNAWVTDDAVTVRAEVPGLSAQDIEVTVDGEELVIAGDRPALELGDGETFHRRERHTGRFERRLELPYRVELDAVDATAKDGVLEIRLPRASEDRPKTIAVQVQ